MFGVKTNESAIGHRYTFQGREIDWTTGLTYFRARWYDPGTGRWLSKDPIGIEGGLNQYEFCGSNPVNNIDPKGESILGFVLLTVAVVSFVGLMIHAVQVADQAYEAGDEMRDLQDAVANGEDIPEGAIGDAQDGIRDALKETEDLAVDMFKDRVKSVPCPE